MELLNLLKRKHVKFTEIEKCGVYLKKQWEDNFAGHLSDKEKKDIFLHGDGCICGYLWHVFSYQKRSCLVGNEAEKAFNDMNKNKLYVFYQFSDDILILENAENLKASDLTDESDIYVVDKDFNWTYVVTHEKDWCGPYFSKRDVQI